MLYVLDTNILLLSLINEAFEEYFIETYRPEINDLVISAVSEGELRSVALQRNWGRRKVQQLDSTLSNIVIYPVKVQRIIDAYAEIDAYSQGKLLSKPLPTGMTARNMGKNDIWIAATAHVNQGKLVTTDQDMIHLDPIFCQVELIDIALFKG